MAQRQLAFLCIALLLWCSLAEARQSQASSAVRLTDLKERLTLIPAGAVIEIKLITNQKILGRLGSVSDSGFEIQHTRNNEVVNEVLTFDSVRSVKVTGKGMHFGIKVVIGTFIAIGVLALIGAVACLVGGCSG